MEQITRKGALLAVVSKYGAVETLRALIADLRSDLSTMEVGVADNNPLMVAKTVESMAQTIAGINSVLEQKKERKNIEKEALKSLSE